MILKKVHNQEDAEDLTIETFAKAFHKLALFKKNHAFTTWLFRIATNHTIDFHAIETLYQQELHYCLQCKLLHCNVLIGSEFSASKDW